MEIRSCRNIMPAFSLIVVLLSTTGLAAGTSEKLFFSSDILYRQSDLLANISEACRKTTNNTVVSTCDLIGLVGDFNPYPWVYDSKEADLLNINNGIWNLFNASNNVVYTQGNHDEHNTAFTSGKFASGLRPGAGGEYFQVYAINTDDFDSECQNLSRFWQSQDRDKTLFVLSHYPFFRKGDYRIDQTAAGCLFNQMDYAGYAGRDIVYVWGHDHGESVYNENLRFIAKPGEKILMDGKTNDYVNVYATKKLNFTVINAGPTVSTPSSWVEVELNDYMMRISRHGASPTETPVAITLNSNSECSIPAYDPEFWNDEGEIQYNNNCYNYATNKITESFAEPGLGSGQIYTEQQCESIMDAAIRDGLAPLLPGGVCPASMTTVALVMNYGSPMGDGRRDYHWYRLDNDGTWSHKPAGGKATNLDYRDPPNPIFNPEDLGDNDPYPDFCGYLCVCSSAEQGESNVNIAGEHD